MEESAYTSGDWVTIGLLIAVVAIAVTWVLVSRWLTRQELRRDAAPRYYRMVLDQENNMIEIQEKQGPHGEWVFQTQYRTREKANDRYKGLVERERMRQLPPEAKHQVLASTEPQPLSNIELTHAQQATHGLSVVPEGGGQLAKKLTEALDRRLREGHTTRSIHDPPERS